MFTVNMSMIIASHGCAVKGVGAGFGLRIAKEAAPLRGLPCGTLPNWDYLTLILILVFLPLLVFTVMVAVPLPTALTLPLLLTVATFLSLVV